MELRILMYVVWLLMRGRNFCRCYSLEYWCFEIVVILAGLLPNPQLQLATLSVWYVDLPSGRVFGTSWTQYV